MNGEVVRFCQKRKQVKESGIIPTFDGFCFPQKEKRETRLFKKNWGRGLTKQKKYGIVSIR